MKINRVLYTLLVLHLAAGLMSSDARAFFFNKSMVEIISDALQSTDPVKVDKCLNKVIKQNCQTGVLKIRRHVKNMIASQRSRMLRSNRFTRKDIENNLLPWFKIDKKAIEYFKKKQVNQKGRNNPMSLYHK